MIKRIQQFLKRFPAPGIYLVFPGRGETKVEDKENKREILIPHEPALILDTSALIDGRIADIVRTGFISGTFIVPSFILNELQQVADSKDPLKRNRGRRGLDILKDLRRSKYTKFKVIKTRQTATTIDESVLDFARRVRGRVVTTDYNLNKVGKVTGIAILNVNELANMVKTVLLPGEEFELSIIRRGKEKNQGVGYLPDGTMVVVEDGENLIGKDVIIRVERLLQTNAGKMIFARPVV